MRVFVIGAGLVGAEVVEALHADHDLTVVDLEPGGLKPLAQRYDVATVAASPVSGRELAAAGIAESDLVIACTFRRRGEPRRRNLRARRRAEGEDDRPHLQRGAPAHGDAPLCRFTPLAL